MMERLPLGAISERWRPSIHRPPPLGHGKLVLRPEVKPIAQPAVEKDHRRLRTDLVTDLKLYPRPHPHRFTG
jgi:hypothetical protein